MSGTRGQAGRWWSWRLFGWWMLINSVGYALIVAGGTALELAASSATRGLVEERRVLAVLVAAVIGSVLQGVVLGRWQWRILRRRMPRLRRRRWVRATLTPAFFVWLLVIAPAAVDIMAQGGNTLTAFRDGFVQALVLGPLIGASQATALRDDTTRWVWWFVSNVTTYVSGALLYELTASILRDLAIPGRAAGYCPLAAFAIHGAWMLWVTAPQATRDRLPSPI